jgi:hypothetical protein
MGRKKLKTGRPVLHGAYSRYSARVLRGQPRLRAYLADARARMLEDLGGEDRLSTAEMIIAGRAIEKLTVLRLIDHYVAREGPWAKPGRLRPVLAGPYLAFSESLRRDLVALGLERRQRERLLAPWEVKIEEEKHE